MAISETTQRVLVAAVGVPLAVAAVFLGGWILAILLAGIAVAASLEFYRMADKKGARPLNLIGSLLSATFVLAALLAVPGGPDAAGFATLTTVGVLVTASAAIWMRGIDGAPLLATAATVFGAYYTGALIAYGLFLRHMPGIEGAWHGTAIVFAPVLVTWASDTFAYFVGRRWGTRKLIPRVSPGKTVQGAIGAILGSVAIAVGYAYVLQSFSTYRLTIIEAIVFGLLISVAAQMGDLAESLLKRDSGVKDSGTLLPGHGGALDRFDSLLFTLPIAYLFFKFIIGVGPGGFP